MCYHGKCLLCIPIEKGSLVCAFIIAIVTGLTMLVSIILGSLTASGAIFILRHEVSISYYIDGKYGHDYEFVPNGGAAAGFFILAVTSLCGLVFAVLLCLGIIRRRPGYVKAYFIYGVIVTALAALVSVILLLVGLQALSVLMLLSCAIYSLFLVLVQKTYFNILDGGDKGTVLTQNQQLIVS